ncbi:MAG: EcsC family protein [Anaeromyxobacteraceae bacterium]
MIALSDEDLAALARAKRTLEHPSLAIRLADKVGMPLEALLRRLPAAAQEKVADGTRRALDTALGVALKTLAGKPRAGPSDWLHRGLVVASGAAGGLAGIAGLVVELPVSLTLMLRSIADHAAAQGEDLGQVSARLECLTVFAYGGRSPDDDAASSSYFAARAALGRAVSQAAQFVAERGVTEALGEKSAPALVQLLGKVAQRLGVAVGDKAAAQLVPLVGAAGGAAVNALFMAHYQDAAWAHFTVRRLERAHGADAVRAAYDRVDGGAAA